MGIYVGNLSYEVTEEHVIELFKDYGFVKRVRIPFTRETGYPLIFAIVDMTTNSEEAIAIKALHGSEWMGRNLTVKKARL